MRDYLLWSLYHGPVMTTYQYPSPPQAYFGANHGSRRCLSVTRTERDVVPEAAFRAFSHWLLGLQFVRRVSVAQIDNSTPYSNVRRSLVPYSPPPSSGQEPWRPMLVGTKMSSGYIRTSATLRRSLVGPYQLKLWSLDRRDDDTMAV